MWWRERKALKVVVCALQGRISAFREGHRAIGARGAIISHGLGVQAVWNVRLVDTALMKEPKALRRVDCVLPGHTCPILEGRSAILVGPATISREGGQKDVWSARQGDIVHVPELQASRPVVCALQARINDIRAVHLVTLVQRVSTSPDVVKRAASIAQPAALAHERAPRALKVVVCARLARTRPTRAGRLATVAEQANISQDLASRIALNVQQAPLASFRARNRRRCAGSVLQGLTRRQAAPSALHALVITINPTEVAFPVSTVHLEGVRGVRAL